jgi:hypothetical protein
MNLVSFDLDLLLIKSFCYPSTYIPELEMDDGDLEPRIPLPREFLLIIAKATSVIR